VKCPNCGHLVLLREDLRTLHELQDERMNAALQRYGKDVTAAARSLGISRSSVYRWLKRREETMATVARIREEHAK
jgi:transcriptional regulator of acetoin/glycerol metabolism